MKKLLLFIVPLSLIFLFSCDKDSFIDSGDARLLTSTDTVKFDTVFTSTGSITKSFKIINVNSQKLRLSSVKLMGGAASPFKININGNAVTEQNDIEVRANDSIYVFVSVFVNPTQADLPFILSDSISINYNGKTKFVQLQAYGQNAVFLDNFHVVSNTSFSNNKPYVILNRLTVDANATLTLPQGTRIFCHANAPVLVNGTLVANGVKNNEIVIAADRLDDPYSGFPASWPGIYFSNLSSNNNLVFTKILNAYQAISLDPGGTLANPKLRLQQCTIDNAFDAGIVATNSSINANNCLISNCGSNLGISAGGNYSFTNCTLASYSNTYLQHKNGVATVLNYINTGGGVLAADLVADFTNCIFWGDSGIVKNELVIDKLGSTVFNLTFNNCIYRAPSQPALATFNNCIRNQDPVFDSLDFSRRIFNFRTNTPGAPGINSGRATAFTKDLDNNTRAIGITDIGAYEKQ